MKLDLGKRRKQQLGVEEKAGYRDLFAVKIDEPWGCLGWVLVGAAIALAIILLGSC